MARYLYMSLVEEKTMQVSNQTDNLINNLKDLKLKLSSDEATNVEKFTYILSDALNSVNNKNISAEGATQLSSEENYTGIPSWVDQAYPYDSKNPRKPNLRELVEVLSGRTVEDLYADPKSEWQTLCKSVHNFRWCNWFKYGYSRLDFNNEI